MPDLFAGGGPPGPAGLRAWVANAFPDPVKNDPTYLAAAINELCSLFFQPSVLPEPELRPVPTDPAGEAERRLARRLEHRRRRGPPLQTRTPALS